MTEEKKSARLIDVPFRELGPMITLLSQNGLDADLAAALRTDDGAKRAVAALKRELASAPELGKSGLIDGTFTWPVDQLRQFEAWQQNEFAWWGFSHTDFSEAKRRMPIAFMRETGSMVAPVLVPYIDDWLAMTNSLWTLIQRQFPGERGCNWMTRDRMKLQSSGTYQGVGLRWEFIDLAAGKGANPLTADARRYPFLATMAAAALHPAWARKLLWSDGGVWLHGLRLCEDNVPLMMRDGCAGHTFLSLTGHRPVNDRRKHAVPRFVEMM